jgi:hypothetical protein
MKSGLRLSLPLGFGQHLELNGVNFLNKLSTSSAQKKRKEKHARINTIMNVSPLV